MTLSGCGLLCQGVHQVVQGTALGVAASVGVGGTASVETSELALVWAAQPYGPAGGASAFDTDSPFDRPPLAMRPLIGPMLQLDAQRLRWAIGTPPFLELARRRVAHASASVA